MQVHNLALQRNKYKHLSDDEWRWFLQQVEGRERTADKLPTFAAMDDWWYPVRLSCEQCSSEQTAKYKASLVSGEKMVDLTGGYGVDTFFLSEKFTQADYVEQDAELCRIAEHNFGNKPITIHNTTAEHFLPSADLYDLLFADPYRRDSHGGKVFRLEDCTPNIVALLPSLLAHLTSKGRILLKLSPMLDITQATNALSLTTWDIYVVAVKNEVKEVLLLSQEVLPSTPEPVRTPESSITAIDLAAPEQAFVFTREEEKDCLLSTGDALLNGAYLYEPNAAILKAGAYKLVAQRFGLQKLDVNTHLYTSSSLVSDFPGRVWRITESTDVKQANVLTRNYPLTPEQLKKKLRVKDGGEAFIIGCRVQGKPTLFHCERI